MSNTNEWRDAARRYAVAAIQQNARAVTDKTPVAVISNTGPDRAILQAAKELTQFLGSPEGSAAQYLLSASGQRITFYAENEGGGFTSITFWDGTGLWDGGVPTASTGMLYMSDTEQARYVADRINLKVCSALTAVERAYNERHGFARAQTQNDPSKFMKWLRSKINEIASRAPNTTSTSAAA